MHRDAHVRFEQVVLPVRVRDPTLVEKHVPPGETELLGEGLRVDGHLHRWHVRVGVAQAHEVEPHRRPLRDEPAHRPSNTLKLSNKHSRIAGAIGFAGVVFGYTTTMLHLPWLLGIVIAVAAAVVIGLVNASLIVAIKANSLIITLAMGTLLDGVSAAITNSQTLGGLPAGMQSLITYRVLGIGAAFWYGVIITVVLWYVLHHMRGGRYVYFTGEGREAANLAGIRVNMVRTVALVVSALGACLGGLIMAGQTGAVQAGVGDSFLLPAFAAVFLGASTIKVGRFNPIGTFLAVILLAVGSDGLQLFGLNTWVTQVYDAAILITAVGFVAIARKTT